MTKEEIIEMARQAGVRDDEHTFEFSQYKYLERFAKLVAKHTLLNTDPSSFMSYQEGVEVGRLAEREACAKVCEQHGFDHYCGNVTDKIAKTIRARGNHD